VHALLDAFVIILQRIGPAAPANITVKEILSTAHSTYATAFTVEGTLGDAIVVEKSTDQATVGPKSDPTGDAILCNWLSGLTKAALQSLNCFPV
jgi:hypothetical protein